MIFSMYKDKFVVHMNTKIDNEELAALEVLKQTGVNVLEATLVAKEALKVGWGRKRIGEHVLSVTSATWHGDS